MFQVTRTFKELRFCGILKSKLASAEIHGHIYYNILYAWKYIIYYILNILYILLYIIYIIILYYNMLGFFEIQKFLTAPLSNLKSLQHLPHI